jgi:hypothetical protein
VTDLRGDGIILLADEDCSKDLIIDTFGADPTLVSSLAACTNLLYDNVGITTKNNLYGPNINPSYVPHLSHSASLSSVCSAKNFVLSSIDLSKPSLNVNRTPFVDL